MTNLELKQVFDTLEKVFTFLKIDYFLIGALAREEWFKKSNLEFRTTQDVDYAVLVGSHEEYRDIKNFLVEKEQYTASSGNSFALISPEGVPVDILPFGEIESDGTMENESLGMTSIRVDGMKEVFLDLISFSTDDKYQ